MQAILLAGDRGAARSVAGQSKPYIRVAGKPLVVHVLESLLHASEVSEVYAVGDAERLTQAFEEFGIAQLSTRRAKPVHIVPQRSSLYENVWHAFLRARPEDCDDPERGILAVPCDIPLLVPEELSEFLEQALALDADYVVGLTPAEALAPYAPRDGEDGIDMACFNLREGRYRQSNLHYVKPLKLGNRHYVQRVYETRYQKEWRNVIALALYITLREFRSLSILFHYALMHLAGRLDRGGRERAAAWVRRWVSLRRVEQRLSNMIRGRFVTVMTSFGGAALDVDNAEDLAVVEKRLEEWKARQIRVARGASIPR